jgi:pimeloyl-ACP methyl ester carboxylesterase
LPRKSGALSEFLTRLQVFIAAESLPVELTLIGHSMGAIVVNKIVKRYPELPYAKIVHMASADSTRNLMETIVPYLQKHHTQFYSLSLHPKNEDREVSTYGLTPSGSLLVWIDNMFTTPETVLDRRSGRWNNMERVIRMIPRDALNRMHFKIFGIGNPEEPQAHGQFDDYRFWSECYWWKST